MRCVGESGSKVSQPSPKIREVLRWIMLWRGIWVSLLVGIDLDVCWFAMRKSAPSEDQVGRDLKVYRRIVKMVGAECKEKVRTSIGMLLNNLPARESWTLALTIRAEGMKYL